MSSVQYRAQYFRFFPLQTTQSAVCFCGIFDPSYPWSIHWCNDCLYTLSNI